MPIFTVGAAGTTSSDFEIAGSAMFYSNSLASRTPSGTTNRRTYTISMWAKRCDILNTNNIIFCAGESTDDQFNIFFREHLTLIDETSNSENFRLVTNAHYYDTSAWYHIVFAVDTTQATASNRLKLYVNGSQVTSFSTETYPTQNLDTNVNRNINHSIGGRGYQSAGYFNGYLAECILVDGQQLTPSSFGEFDTDSGIWKPISPTGITFGTNGHYYNFATKATDPVDASGNGLNMSSSNVLATDYAKDTPLNNHCVINAQVNTPYTTLSDGNLFVDVTSTGSSSHVSNYGSIAFTSGKWYFEAKATGGSKYTIGLSDVRNQSGYQQVGGTNNIVGYHSNSYVNGDAIGWYFDTIRKNGSVVASGLHTIVTNDIMMCAIDADNGKIWWGYNGTWDNSGDPAAGSGNRTTFTTGETYVMAISNEDCDWTMNFGSPLFSISSGNSDGNGHGNFEYTVPTGFYTLNSKNLAEFG